MTRSLEMVERQRSIYWKAIFGHQKGSEWFGYFSEYRRVTGIRRGKYWAFMGLSGKERRATRGGRTPPHGLVLIGQGRGRRPLLSFSLSYSFPLSPLGKGRVLQLGLGILVGLPYRCAPPRPASSSLLYIRGQGHPKGTSIVLFAVCDGPSTVYSSGHGVVVLK